MKQSRKAYVSAWVLLSVFVPMVLLSSLHVHPQLAHSALQTCEQCVDHQMHSGHISPTDAHIDCFLCHFNSNVYLSGVQQVFTKPVELGSKIILTYCPALLPGNAVACNSRGPPAFIILNPAV